MQEAWVPSLGWENPLEEEMTTHPSILAGRIPWTEEPRGLQSVQSQRIRYDWAHSWAAVRAVTKNQVWLSTLSQVPQIRGIIWYLSFSIWFILLNIVSSTRFYLWRQGQDRAKAGSWITLLNSSINPLPKALFTSEHFGYLVNIFHLLFKHIWAYIFYYLQVKRW